MTFMPQFPKACDDCQADPTCKKAPAPPVRDDSRTTETQAVYVCPRCHKDFIIGLAAVED